MTVHSTSYQPHQEIDVLIEGYWFPGTIRRPVLHQGYEVAYTMVVRDEQGEPRRERAIDTFPVQQLRQA